LSTAVIDESKIINVNLRDYVNKSNLLVNLKSVNAKLHQLEQGLRSFNKNSNNNLLQAFSSEPSAQFGSPLQNLSLSIQSPLPQANLPVSQIGSSVASKGVASLGSFIKTNEKVNNVR